MIGMPRESEMERQLRREAILLQLEAASPASLPSGTLLAGLRLSGHGLDVAGLLRELDYLEGRGLVKTCAACLDRSVKRARLTSAGRDYLEAEGLA